MTESKAPWRVVCVAGARPNFIKIGPLMHVLSERSDFSPYLVHTGQHYDERLSKVFFDELAIPRPALTLGVGSGSHAAQTARVMAGFESVLAEQQPHAVVVVGDVNSTVACALVTSKFQLSEAWCENGRRRPLLVHVEAGLRSGDEEMPEEINRRVTDAISDLLLVSDPAGMDHLAREGATADRVHYVGNVMIDTLERARARAEDSQVLSRLDVKAGCYLLVTMHRPANVDDVRVLRQQLDALERLEPELPLVFPMHPRTRARFDEAGESLDPKRWRLTEPLGYLDFLRLQMKARAVLTDSGGIQEETTVLGVPCVTLRDNTERPITVSVGSNVLAGTDPKAFAGAYRKALEKTSEQPDLWDGNTATRIAERMAERLAGAARS